MAGLGTWLVVVAADAGWHRPGAAGLGAGGGHGWRRSPRSASRSRLISLGAMARRVAASLALLAVQSAAGLTMVATSAATRCARRMLVIVAAQRPGIFRHPWASRCGSAAQTVLLTVVLGAFRRRRADAAVRVSAAFGGFQTFAAATIAAGARERAAREELARTNAELHATRALLAESSRAAERLRISRDLHDTLGHHLTALSLQLDVASRLADGRAAEHVQQAHAIARLLLGRRPRRRQPAARPQPPWTWPTRCARSLRAAGDAAVHLDMPPSLGALDDDRAQAHRALRPGDHHQRRAPCRARATCGSPSTDGPDGIALHARDDGRGAGAVAWGNGLTGMRERFEELAGRVEVETRAGGGFEVHGVMPRSAERRSCDDPCGARGRPDAGAARHPVAAGARAATSPSSPKHRDGEEGLAVIAPRAARRRAARHPHAAQERPRRAARAAGASALPPTIVLTTFDDDEVLLEGGARRRARATC